MVAAALSAGPGAAAAIADTPQAVPPPSAPQAAPPPSAPSTQTTAGTPHSSPAASPVVWLRAEQARVVPGGAQVLVGCLSELGSCPGVVTLSAGQAMIGSTATVLRSGRIARVTVKLNPRGHALLARRHLLGVVLRVALVSGDAQRTVFTNTLVLKAPASRATLTGTEIVRYAKRFIGRPYVFGANGPRTFDCSGFTAYVYAHFGYHLQRSSYAQMTQGRPVRGPLQPGDLVLWDDGGHVGIYVDHRRFISATVHRGIWIYGFGLWSQTQRFTTARRILGDRRLTKALSIAHIARAAARLGPAAPVLPRNGGPADATP